MTQKKKKIWSNTLLYNKNSGRLLIEIETANNFNDYFIDLPQKTIKKEYGDIDKIERNLTSNYSILNSAVFFY